MTAVAPGKFAGVIEAKKTLVVELIDKAARTVVIKNAKGETMKVVAGNEVKNFDQIKVGDHVVTTYTQVPQRRLTRRIDRKTRRV